MMRLYRRLLLIPYYIRFPLVTVPLLATLSAGVYLRNRAQREEQVVPQFLAAMERFMQDFRSKEEAAELWRTAYELFTGLVGGLHGYSVRINDGHFAGDVREGLHKSTLVRGLDHICVIGRKEPNTFFIGVPEELPDFHWLNVFFEPAKSDYQNAVDQEQIIRGQVENLDRLEQSLLVLLEQKEEEAGPLALLNLDADIIALKAKLDESRQAREIAVTVVAQGKEVIEMLRQQMENSIREIRQHYAELDENQAYGLKVLILDICLRDNRILEYGLERTKRIGRWRKISTGLFYVAIPLAALLVFLLMSLTHLGLDWTIRTQMRLAGLDGEEEFQYLYNSYISDWLAGRNMRGLVVRLAKSCRRLKDEQLRQAEQERKARLRQIANEEHARRLEEKAKRRATLAALRMAHRQSSVSQEMRALREEVEEEAASITDTKQRREIGRLIEASFVEEIQARQREKAAEEAERRQVATRTVKASCHGLELVEDMLLEDLEVLAFQIREIKRRINRAAWRCLTDQLDPTEPETYHWVIELARAGDYQSIEERLLSKDQKTESQVIRARQEEPPQLINGQSVLLVGGAPGLGPFYVDQLKSIGAGRVVHIGDGSMTKIKEARADIVLVFRWRVAHKHQWSVQKNNEVVICIDHVGKSKFLQGVIDALEAQLD